MMISMYAVVMAQFEVAEAQQALDGIVPTLVAWQEKHGSIFSFKDRWIPELLEPAQQLRDVIRGVQPKQFVQLTLGNKPLRVSSFGKVLPDVRIFESKHDLQPGETLPLTYSRQVIRGYPGSLVSSEWYFSNGSLAIGVSGLAKALSQKAELSIVDTDAARVHAQYS